jgi:hypothetical protein
MGKKERKINKIERGNWQKIKKGQDRHPALFKSNIL